MTMDRQTKVTTVIPAGERLDRMDVGTLQILGLDSSDIRPGATLGGPVTVETEAKSSVTLKEDAKGYVRVDEVKVYANDAEEAAREAVRVMFLTKALIAAEADKKFHDSLAASLGATRQSYPAQPPTS